jgi:hypothetical protein
MAVAKQVVWLISLKDMIPIDSPSGNQKDTIILQLENDTKPHQHEGVFIFTIIITIY